MTAQTRIYRYRDRLIRASHPSHVVAFVALELDKPRIASQEDLEDLFGRGVKVETVKQPEQGE